MNRSSLISDKISVVALGTNMEGLLGKWIKSEMDIDQLKQMVDRHLTEPRPPSWIDMKANERKVREIESQKVVDRLAAEHDQMQLSRTKPIKKSDEQKVWRDFDTFTDDQLKAYFAKVLYSAENNGSQFDNPRSRASRCRDEMKRRGFSIAKKQKSRSKRSKF